MDQPQLARRHVLGVMAAGAMAAACSDSGGEPGEGRGAGGEDTPAPGEYRESPMLAELVESGELPPVKERLPAEPYVLRPGLLVDVGGFTPEIGTHGGTLELAQEGPEGDPIIFIGMNEGLLWAPNGFDFDAGIEGNVVAGWEANDDDTVFTFHLREGLKWSDGEPVTMDAVRFAFDDVLYNEEITTLFPQYLRAGARADGATAELEVVDDLTFSLKFPEPYGTFPAQLAISGWRGYGDIIKPRHYLEQFHKDYADPTEFAELLDSESVAEDQWGALFEEKQLTGWLWNMTTETGLGHPTLCAWVLTNVSGEVFSYERNPFYFKIDAEGNQLPYMDKIRSQVVQNKETLTSRALFGEFDYLGERATFRQLPLMADKADQGDVKLFVPRQHVLPTTIFLNLTHPDEVWRGVVRDVRFRRALSLALNYEEIVENFYLGEFASVPKVSNPGEHNPEEAERLLDEMGLDAKDDEGFRLGPDGKRFTVPFELADLSENHIPLGELVAEYWKEVGVNTTVQPVDGTTRGERATANELKATIVWVHFPIWGTAGWDDYLPHTNWGPLWQEWYTSQGEAGEEPPDEVKELFDLHGEFQSATIASPESQEAHQAIVKSHYDNLWNLQVVEDAYWPTFFTTRVKNVPEGVKQDVFGIIATYSMEQWYLDGE